MGVNCFRLFVELRDCIGANSNSGKYPHAVQVGPTDRTSSEETLNQVWTCSVPARWSWLQPHGQLSEGRNPWLSFCSLETNSLITLYPLDFRIILLLWCCYLLNVIVGSGRFWCSCYICQFCWKVKGTHKQCWILWHWEIKEDIFRKELHLFGVLRRSTHCFQNSAWPGWYLRLSTEEVHEYFHLYEQKNILEYMGLAHSFPTVTSKLSNLEDLYAVPA